MLMQNFKAAADLGITEPQKDALVKTLVLLETGGIVHAAQPPFGDLNTETTPAFSGKFNMDNWSLTFDGCGTIACIGGTAELIGGVDFGSDHDDLPKGLYGLFYPVSAGRDWEEITTAQAATALRSYLSTGDARWDLAVS